MVLADFVVNSRLSVLATGGGAISREFNRVRMKIKSLIVYLITSPNMYLNACKILILQLNNSLDG